jgi:hypothetical protein
MNKSSNNSDCKTSKHSDKTVSSIAKHERQDNANVTETNKTLPGIQVSKSGKASPFETNNAKESDGMSGGDVVNDARVNAIVADMSSLHIKDKNSNQNKGIFIINKDMLSQ